jgi:hypothetical protein
MKASLLKNGILLAAFPVLLEAQRPRTPIYEPPPIRGVSEVTLSASGGSNRRLSHSFGGASASYGAYINNEWQGVVRQSVNYLNPDGGPTRWHGSTRIAADYHFTDLGMLMPFLGANFGRIYGSALRDTWTAGLEGGAKYYLARRAFVFGMGEYNFLFRSTREIDRNFGRGQFTFTTGIGFNF